ncbi:mitochondrial inner membrane protein OXA1L [Frankliniella occidentalis]|uniref:Mitochondrial inner membrane protein OXA1L n=1 Tax=Frankliniella occidentalis TaxID=133901 RepID=A0A6J1RW20_FRAOC|nr:mitochondrial inner membrane protein OXA1L [Frankliniella occidentalis]
MFSKRLVGLHQRVRYSCAVFSKHSLNTRLSNSGTILLKKSPHLHPSLSTVRYSSSNSVVPPVITKAIEAATSTGNDSFTPASVEEVIKSIGPIPEIPALPGPKVLELLANGEPSLTSLGLGGWSPYGLLQHLLEFVHVSTDLSWGWTIVAVAALIRVLCFKLVVRTRQESIKTAHVLPQMQFLQQKMLEARQQNDIIEASRYAMELSNFTKEQPSMYGALKYGLAQGAILLSFTQALRSMCNLPVEALQTGGFYSIVDLTMKDPTMLLPAANGLLFYIHLLTAKEIQNMFPGKNPIFVHAGMVGVSAALFLISMNFQGAIVLYWISSQCVTLIQHRVLKHPRVKEYYNLGDIGNAKIAEMLKKETAKKTSSTSKLGFWSRIKEAQVNNRLADEVKRRAELDSAAFERAGREPIRKTYKYDVTKIKK